MIAIVDYGVGNLFSLKSSLTYLGLDNTVTGDAQTLAAADHIILPGVGAFADAMAKLKAKKLDLLLCDLAKQGKPLLGICLGMQLLFEKSYEYGEHPGLSLIEGSVCPIADDLKPGSALKIPHIGWNRLHLRQSCPILAQTAEGAAVYFVHSYYAKHCDKNLAATAEYGIDVAAVVQNGNVFGTQFHPEKSGNEGLKMLKAFAQV